MSNYINVRTSLLYYAELFNKPCLYCEQRIQSDSVPKGWHSYCLCGTTKNPTVPATLEDSAAMDFAGSIVSPVPLKRAKTERRRIGDSLYIDTSETMTLAAFCREHGFELPAERLFPLRPATKEEAALFYSQEGKDEALGTVGHVRMDFGSGTEFWPTWWPHIDRLNTPEVRAEGQAFVDEYRVNGPLESLGAMSRYCWQHPEGRISDRAYGYIAETERYRFCLRCTPEPGNYQGYLYVYDLQAAGGDKANAV